MMTHASHLTFCKYFCFLPKCTKWQLLSHFSVTISTQRQGEGEGVAFTPNSRHNYVIEISELLSSHTIFQLELRKLFQSQMLCLTRNKYWLKRLPTPSVILQFLA